MSSTHKLIPFTSKRAVPIAREINMAHYKGLSLKDQAQISAESFPWALKKQLLLKQLHKNSERLFKDAFPFVYFWVRLISLLLGRPQSLPHMSGLSTH